MKISGISFFKTKTKSLIYVNIAFEELKGINIAGSRKQILKLIY